MLAELGDVEEAHTALENHAGCFESLSAYAAELTEDTTHYVAAKRREFDQQMLSKY